MSLLEEELGSWLTLSSLKGRQLSFISFQRIKKAERWQEGKRDRDGCLYCGLVVIIFFFADARHSGFNRAHFKTQHSCLLCIWAPDGKRREERRGEREAEERTRKKTGNKNEREQETDREKQGT